MSTQDILKQFDSRGFKVKARKKFVPYEERKLALYKNNESPPLSEDSNLVKYRMLKEFQDAEDPEPVVAFNLKKSSTGN